MKDIVSLCKRRGFIFAASEIYGGINGFWDYGPLGVELKNNLRDRWWKDMVITPPIGPDGSPVEIVGVDSAIIQNPKAWVASGHVGGFSDPMMDDRETKLRYRADHIKYFVLETVDGSYFTVEGKKVRAFAFMQDTPPEEIERRLKKFKVDKKYISSDGKLPELVFSSGDGIPLEEIIGPDASKPGTLTEPKAFNLMFQTYVGAMQSEDSIAYLRPETAQGIFLNYKNVLDSSRVRVPFGIAQIGKAFRNEVNPRNFIFRSREFEQMELEWFCHPSEAKIWRDFWFAERQRFWKSVGLSSANLQIRDHDSDELSHYAKAGLGTADIEYRFPFTAPGFGELEGIAHRCDFDLTQHQEHSGAKLEYMDPNDNTNRFIPHVIEPAAGLSRGVLALICEAYTVDEKRPSGLYLNFHPSMAPKKAAILPLTAKDEHVPLAQKLYLDIREDFAVDLDIKQNIGKRYARQDEIGTPYCFTIDNDTVNDQTVTVRERNTMAQERIHMDKVKSFLHEKIRRSSV
ncbi:MAG: glycine--tRNA ligase [Alphaproteobacteria bacterium]|nr:glycine--tRNA ligase [Alphaproteobacteria bacterium]